MSFRPPNKEDYEQYRHRQKNPSMNRQPLPRSSYKSDYLVYLDVEEKPLFKNMDSYKWLNKSCQKDSTYSKDYHTMKT